VVQVVEDKVLLTAGFIFSEGRDDPCVELDGNVPVRSDRLTPGVERFADSEASPEDVFARCTEDRRVVKDWW